MNPTKLYTLIIIIFIALFFVLYYNAYNLGVKTCQHKQELINTKQREDNAQLKKEIDNVVDDATTPNLDSRMQRYHTTD